MPRPKRTLAAIGPVEQQAIQPRARVIIDLVEDMPPSARLLYDILAMMPKELALLIHSFWLHEIEVWDETRATHEIGRGFEDLYASTEKDLLDGHVYGDDDLDELTSQAIGVFQSSRALVRGIVHTGQGRRFETNTGLFYADDSAAMSKDFIVVSASGVYPLSFGIVEPGDSVETITSRSDKNRKAALRGEHWFGEYKTETSTVRGQFLGASLDGPCCLVVAPDKLCWGEYRNGVLVHGTCIMRPGAGAQGSPFIAFHGNAETEEATMAIEGIALGEGKGNVATGTFDLQSAMPTGSYFHHQQLSAKKSTARFGAVMFATGFDACHFVGFEVHWPDKFVTEYSIDCTNGRPIERVQPLMGRAAASAVEKVSDYRLAPVKCRKCRDVYDIARQMAIAFRRDGTIPELDYKQ